MGDIPNPVKLRLKLYRADGSFLAEYPYLSVYLAVKAGYDSGHDFIVCEPEGEPPKLYWNGRQWDKHATDFFTWEAKAKTKDRLSRGNEV